MALKVDREILQVLRDILEAGVQRLQNPSPSDVVSDEEAIELMADVIGLLHKLMRGRRITWP
jgi:hypothetical protein